MYEAYNDDAIKFMNWHPHTKARNYEAKGANKFFHRRSRGAADRPKQSISQETVGDDGGRPDRGLHPKRRRSTATGDKKTSSFKGKG